MTSGPSSDRGAAGAGATTNVVVNNYGTEQASVDRRRNMQGGEDITVTIGKVIAHDFRSNGPAGQALRQHYGAATVPIQR